MGWQNDWIEQAEEIVRTEFNLSYGSLDTSWATSQDSVLGQLRTAGPNLAGDPKVNIFTK